MKSDNIKIVRKIISALDNEDRQAILGWLEKEDLRQSQILKRIELDQTHVQYHMRVLVSAGLAKKKKAKREAGQPGQDPIYFVLNKKKLAIINTAINAMCRA